MMSNFCFVLILFSHIYNDNNKIKHRTHHENKKKHEEKANKKKHHKRIHQIGYGRAGGKPPKTGNHDRSANICALLTVGGHLCHEFFDIDRRCLGLALVRGLSRDLPEIFCCYCVRPTEQEIYQRTTICSKEPVSPIERLKPRQTCCRCADHRDPIAERGGGRCTVDEQAQRSASDMDVKK